jgi:hypothetical protein
MKPLFAEPAAREDKPAFAEVPRHIIDDINARLMGKIVAGETVYGSFSASAGFVMTFDSGYRIFVKGSHPNEMAHGTAQLRQEIAACENLAVLEDIAPFFISVVEDGDEDGWMLGIWEYAGKDKGRTDAEDFAAIYESLLRMQNARVQEGAVPAAAEKRYISAMLADDKKWKRIRDEKPVREKFLSLFEDKAVGAAWLDKNIGALAALQEKGAADAHTMQQGLVHGDLRRDNLLLTGDKCLIVDWPNACVGPLLFDLVFLFTHLESLGLGMAEKFFDDYAAFGGPSFSPASRLSLTALVAGHFADQAYRDVPARLPRLRWMQKMMLAGALHALARAGAVESIPRFAGEAA